MIKEHWKVRLFLVSGREAKHAENFGISAPQGQEDAARAEVRRWLEDHGYSVRSISRTPDDARTFIAYAEKKK